jgi:hypothetical protein
MEKEKDGIKKEFIFSPIFEKEEDCTDHPFVFEKTNLAEKSPLDGYPEKRMSGLMYKEKSSYSKTGNQEEDVIINPAEANLKECYFVLTDDRLI